MREVSKDEFREAYFRYGRGRHGWTQDYWICLYEQTERGPIRYLVEPPKSEREDRMMIVDDHAAGECRMFFLSEEDEARLFGD